MIKKFLAAMAAIMLAIAMFGAATAAPAQAIVGSTAYYDVRDNTIPSNSTIRVVRTNGITVDLAYGAQTSNALSICPRYQSWYLKVTRPSGTVWTGGRGDCFNPNGTGTYRVHQKD